MNKKAMLYRTKENSVIDCFLCEHRCRIPSGQYGVCGVRRNHNGQLISEVYGEVIAANADPIEKKPLYHFLPGTQSFSVATIGCNFKCSFCQNWQISQTNKRNGNRIQGQFYSPEKIIQTALSYRCKSMAYTYSEPTVFFEFAYDLARLAKSEGLGNVFVTNGFMTPEALQKIQPYLDAANVDLKSFRDEFYRKICKGRLEPVLNTIRLMRELNIWVEVTTLIIPGQNDSIDELRSIAEFLVGVDNSIPWHISRYHPDYEFDDAPATPAKTLHQAAEIGKEAGLKYIYIGNLPGESATTQCPECGETLIQRSVFSTSSNAIKNGKCPNCKARIEGVFEL